MMEDRRNTVRIYFLFIFLFLSFSLQAHLQDSALVIYKDTLVVKELHRGDYVVIHTLWGETLSGGLDIVNQRRIAVDGLIVPLSRIKRLIVKGWLYKAGNGLVKAGKWLFHRDISWVCRGRDVDLEDIQAVLVLFAVEFFFFVCILVMAGLLFVVGEFFKIFGHSYDLRHKWHVKVCLRS